jgi:hypothetical protein
MKYTILLIVSLIVMIACKSEKEETYTEDIIEVYKVITENGESVRGAMTFSESDLIDPGGRIVQHNFYNADGSFKGKEIFDLAKNSDKILGSKYYDGQDSLLSYYKFVYDEEKVARKIAFDAANDDMLRIESFEYDDQGRKRIKDIKSSDDVTQRRYVYTYDEDGNENMVTIINPAGEIIFRENYQVTQVNDKLEWRERWGLIDDKPNSYSLKSVRILKRKI